MQLQLPGSGRPCALVTGASSGLGLAFAERLARDSYNLVLVARRLARLNDIAGRLRQMHHIEVQAIGADLNDVAGLAEVEARLAANDAPAILINNAGFAGYHPFASVEPKVIDDLIGIHIRAVARTTRAALPGMIRRGGGGIINISGLLALAASLPPAPLPPRAVYGAAKAFILAFTQTVAEETKDTGVRIQVCLPGRIDTDFHAEHGLDTGKLPPAMPAAEVAAASLAAFARGETICVPGLADPALFDAVNDAQLTVFRTAAMHARRVERYA